MAANSQKIITNNFKNYSVNQFIESLTEPANTIFYVFAGKHTEYDGGDSNVPYPNNSIQSLNIDVYNEMLFAKQVTSSDVIVMIPRYDWVAGTVFTQYDDKDGELYKKNFYTVTRSGSSYYVFKCLFNNYGSPSTIVPDFNETSADDVFFETSDGYQWKYLYTISKAIFDKFATTDYIPVVADANVAANAVFGSIDVIAVTSNGTGYNNHYSGQFNNEDVGINGNLLVFNIGTDASIYNDFYNTCILKIVEGKGKGGFRKIDDYRIKGKTKQVIVNSAFSVTPDSTSVYEISPFVEIIGDGNQTINAEARALINTAASNSVYKIEVLNRGKDYFYATANVKVSDVISVTNSAVLSVLMPPPGGHGANVQSELGGIRAGISVSFSNSEIASGSDTILAQNDYRTVGIIKDPYFANIQLTLSSISGTFSQNEKVYQVRPIEIGGLVSISTSSNTITTSTINFKDAFKVNDPVYIADLKGSEITNILIGDGGSGYVPGQKLTFTGSGSDALAFAITSNGVIDEVRIDSITAVTLSGSLSGEGFRNNQVVTITGAGGTGATGSATINGSGNVTSVAVINGGKTYTSGGTVTITGTNVYANGSPLFASVAARTFNASTAVSSGSETITITGHGLVTNDIVTYNNGGGTNISGLTSGSTYYVIKVDDNTIQLRTTYGTGTAINLTAGLNQTHSLTPFTSSIVSATYTITGITSGGSGFAVSDTVYIKGNSSQVNTATGIVSSVSSGALTGVTITDGSSNYVEYETVQVFKTSNPAVVATATVDTANGVITSSVIASGGSGYTSAPTVGLVAGSGSGASLTAVVNTTPVSSRRMLTKVTAITSPTTMTIEKNGLFTDSTATIFLADVGSYGIVDLYQNPTLKLQNCVGFFTADSFVVGNTSLATANIQSIQINGKTKPYTTISQSIKLSGGSITGTFIEDEQINQSPSVANAFLYYANNEGDNTVYVTEKQGTFYSGDTITGAESGASLTINTIIKGDLVPWSGDVMYIQNMDPISRAKEQSETVKIILEL